MSMTTPTRSPPKPTNSSQVWLRLKAEEINLVLLEPDVDLWKLRELALSEGGLVNDTIRRRAWPKLVGLTSYDNDPDDAQVSPGQSKSNKKLRKGTAPDRVTNFGQDENQRATAFTGGIFDQHDTAAIAALPEDDNTSLESSDSLEPSDVVACIDAEQIERDVTRCTWHLLTGGQRSRRRIMLNKHRKKISGILRRKQRRLGDLINLTLAVSEHELPTQDRLCYFQGYHDVASIVLAALGGASCKSMDQQNQPRKEPSTESTTAAAQAVNIGLELPSKVLYQISLSHFREPMRSNFMNLQTTLRMVLMPLVNVLDPELHAHLYGCGMEPFFALSWLLTWFSHDIRDTLLVKRLFDFFLVSHPLMPIYLTVAMICHPSNRQEVLATPCEFAELHNVLQGLPKNSSMVGWKWSVGVDGYVSDDEQDGEDGETSISLDSDMVSHLSGGQYSTIRGQTLSSGSDGRMTREDLILSESQAHVVSMGMPAHVPFQELINSAISLMARVPPRKLHLIASRYFDEQQAQTMLEMYPSISFFHHPPSWALKSTAKADWVLKHRAREVYGMASGDRRSRMALTELRNRNNTISCETSTATDQTARVNRDDSVEGNCTPESIAKRAMLLKWPKAMVAQGFGPGEDEVARQNRRHKLLWLGGAATVAILAIALGFAIQYGRPSSLQLRGEAASGTSSDFIKERKDGFLSHVGYTPTISKRTKISERQPAFELDARSPHYLTRSAPTSSALENVDSNLSKPASDSLIQTMFQKYVVRELQIIYAKLRFLMATFGALNESINDRAFGDNVQAALSQVATTVAKVQDPAVRAAIHKSVARRAVQASQHVGRFAKNVFQFASNQAKIHLGGGKLNELELL